MTKDELRRELHRYNPYAGYLHSALTKVQLERTLERYRLLDSRQYDKLPKREQ